MKTDTAMPRPPALFTAEQIDQRVRDLGRQISADYRGRTLHLFPVLDNSWIFAADLVRALDLPVTCQFIKPLYRDRQIGRTTTREIFFIPEIEVHGHDVLLLEGVLHSGVTTDFLISAMHTRGGASVKLATLLDRPSARRVALRPDYFGFQVGDEFLVGYGLGSPHLRRNLPYVAAQEPGEDVT